MPAGPEGEQSLNLPQSAMVLSAPAFEQMPAEFWLSPACLCELPQCYACGDLL